MPPDQTPSLIGQTIDRRYEVKRLLGSGGMGEVYLALDERTGGPVVLKAPWPGMLIDDPGLRKRFIREIRVMSRLDHPNIIKVYDVVEHEGRPVAVMQYLSGGDLEAQSKLPVDRWLPQIASALDYLHLNKLVHRDVKPANIFFDSHKTPYLGDFGIVKALQGSGTAFATLHGGTQTGFAMGTPKYMSPEAVEGRELDGRSDQYALTIMVYERLAGRMPFDGETPAHIFAAHLTAKPRPLSEIDSHYGEAISEVLNRALAKRPEERFGDCRQFAKAVLKSLAVPLSRGSTPSQKTPPTPTRPPVAPTPTPHPIPTPRPPTLKKNELAGVEVSSADPSASRAGAMRDAISRLPWSVWATTAGVAVALVVVLSLIVAASRSSRGPSEASPVATVGPAPTVSPESEEPSETAAPVEDVTPPEPPEEPVVEERILEPKEPTETAAPVEQFTVSFTVREEDTSGRLVEGAAVEVFSRESADGPAQSLGSGNSDTRGRVSLVLRPTAAQQAQGDFGATVRADEASKTYRLEGFPQTRRFSLYLPKASPPPLASAPFDAHQARRHQEAWAKHLGTPREIENCIGMKLVLIPPGEFMMGSPASEGGRRDNEGPQHRVRITKPVYLGVHEVTQAEYERVMGTNPSRFKTVSGQDTSHFPVEFVSWNDAMEFCRELSALSAERSAGREYRLPTEAQWEYACRAGTTTPFHFGSGLNGRQANANRNYPDGASEKVPDLGRTTTVGSYGANSFGLYDMHGNVWEWCSDWFDAKYYANSPVDDPQGPASGSDRVYRGGGWDSRARNCRSAYRYGFTPDFRFNDLGFRVALVPADESSK